MITASAPPIRSTPSPRGAGRSRRRRVFSAERYRQRRRARRRMPSAGRGRAGRRDQRADEQQLDEQRESLDREVDHDDHRHRASARANARRSQARVPRIGVRAQLGRGYSRRNPGVPVHEQHPEGVVRVRADNPSPLTLDGTNTYVVGALDRRSGPGDPAHLDAVRRAAGDGIEGVVLTHSHADHSEAAELFGAPVTLPVDGAGGRPVPRARRRPVTPRTACAS